MFSRARRSNRRSPPVTGRYVCPACFRQRDEGDEKTCCGYGGEPVDRAAGELADVVVVARRIPGWRWWGGDIAPLAVCGGSLVPWVLLGPLSLNWGIAIGVSVLIGRWRSLRLRRQQPREVRVGPEGVERIGPRGECLRVRWTEVEECRALGSADTLCIRAGDAEVPLEGRMPGYDAAKRTVLARSPVLSPISIWHSPMSRRTASRLLAVVAVLAAVGLVAMLVCVGNQR